MTSVHNPTSVLLVGNVPLDSAEEVFTKLSSALPSQLLAISDGETGERSQYVFWQESCFPPETIRFIGRDADAPSDKAEQGPYTIDSIKPTRYDEAALSSYTKFCQLRREGVISKDVRFQVCLPSAYNCVQAWVEEEHRKEIYPLYEARLQEAVAHITKEIPAEDLAIQFDLALEVMALEYDQGRPIDLIVKPWFSPIKENFLQKIRNLCTTILAPVKLGFHLCYGDRDHKHFVEPEDASLMVGFANDIVRAVSQLHEVAWVHMPVPKSRTDVAYFEPLRDLKLGEGLLFLGLVHANDEAGTKRRIEVARSAYPHPFGVATECGLGRTPREEVDSILQISRAVTVER